MCEKQTKIPHFTNMQHLLSYTTLCFSHAAPPIFCYPLLFSRSTSYSMLPSAFLMQHLLFYATFCFSHAAPPILCYPLLFPPYITHDSISFSALVTCLLPCCYIDLLFCLPAAAAELPPKAHILYRHIPKINFDFYK
jgi:hypothetical protein